MKQAKYSVVESFVVYKKYIPDIDRKGGKYPSPFRQENIASFSIDGVTGRWYDFGLGIGGDVISFIQALHKTDFKRAIDMIDRDLDGYDSIDLIRNSGKLEKKCETLKHRYSLTTEYRNRCYESLIKDTKYLPMLIRRGLSIDIIKKFQVGLSTYKSKNWLITPYDYYNEICWHYKRIRWNNSSKEIMTSGQACLYPRDSINNDLPIVLCEGELDCLALISSGINAITSTAGCATFKREWYKYFVGKEVIILYDYDEPGTVSAINIQAKMFDTLKPCRIVRWDDIVTKPFTGFDVSDYFWRNGSVNLLKQKLGLI